MSNLFPVERIERPYGTIYKWGPNAYASWMENSPYYESTRYQILHKGTWADCIPLWWKLM